MTIEEYLLYLKENPEHKIYDDFGNIYTYYKEGGYIIVDQGDYEDTLSEKEFKEMNPKLFMTT